MGDLAGLSFWQDLERNRVFAQSARNPPVELADRSFSNVTVLNVLDSSFPVATAAVPVLNRRVYCGAQKKQSRQRQGQRPCGIQSIITHHGRVCYRHRRPGRRAHKDRQPAAREQQQWRRQVGDRHARNGAQ